MGPLRTSDKGIHQRRSRLKMLLDNEEFLKQLKALFESTTQSGSVFLTQKRFTYEETPSSNADTDMPEASTSTSSEKQYSIIIKATDGKNASSKTKISTIVQPQDHTTFMTAYGQLLKSCFNTMRKKDKRKKKELKGTSGSGSGSGEGKKKAGPAAKTAMGSSVIPKVFGSRRGPGHAKRQRLEKARRKAVKHILNIRKRRSRTRRAAAAAPVSKS